MKKNIKSKPSKPDLIDALIVVGACKEAIQFIRKLKFKRASEVLERLMFLRDQEEQKSFDGLTYDRKYTEWLWWLEDMDCTSPDALIHAVLETNLSYDEFGIYSRSTRKRAFGRLRKALLADPRFKKSYPASYQKCKYYQSPLSSTWPIEALFP